MHAQIATELLEAEQDIHRHRGDRFEQFARVRTAMGRLATVDAFYVAEFVGAGSVHYHHQYDGDTFDLPGSMPIAPGRTAHWVRTHRRSYTFAEDGGRALHAGVPFGDTEKISRDAIVTPIFDDSQERNLLGLVSIQTYTPGSYDRHTVEALEYLADSLGGQIAYEKRIAERSRRLGGTARPAEDVLGDVLVTLGELHAKFSTRAVPELRREVERILSELWARELHQQRLVAERLETLTPRQRELAELLVQLSGDSVPTTAELARAMGISTVTVKTHMNIVLRAFDAKDRGEVRAAIQRLTRHRSYQV
ncbi:helix-turn-helix transcriptional regulator [Amycolatopsis sp.]|uniref:helix-turn-helix transcriptional regulator n=1 Tax=Amycolatopsis sp. TaxID=37632 RepID=UPI002C787B64|nr:GAF domain-containing protein [Amycolatopsis sp.]HVV12728.1 GAF domain-containing protein [Amycolatopsis sp.]